MPAVGKGLEGGGDVQVDGVLYHSRDVADLARMNPDVPQKLGAHARAVVSEPIGKFSEAWVAVPQSTSVRVRGAELEVKPFAPQA